MTKRRRDVEPATTLRIKDVAEKLGMSVATVSRAVSKPDRVNAETRQRVLAAVEKLGYKPNVIARSLRQGQSKSLLMITPTHSQFFIDIYVGAEAAAREMGFTTLLACDEGNTERELAYFDQVLSGRADGIISLTGFVPSAFAPGKRSLPPFVAALEPLEGHNTPVVRIDHRSGAYVATRHLIDLGHRRIGHISGHRRAASSAHRLAGYKDALSSAGIAFDSGLVQPGDFSVKSGEAAMTQLLRLSTPPTAVFAANDEMAIGAMIVARRQGLAVPEKLSVVGFDDQSLAAINNPPLTTVSVPRQEIGRRAAQELINVLNGKPPAGEVVMRTQLIERESTAKLARPKSRQRRSL
jgi:LacI family transcriptional regulator, repressor for deo operon, udp, cdd, tsx, nupC, and nupG